MKSSFLSAFYFDLLQDVNILRPLIYLIADDFGQKPTMILSRTFCKRDSQNLWINEITAIARETNSNIIYQSSLHQIWELANQFCSGFIISSSESDLRAHNNSHNIFKIMPKSITKITLQHGYECVGFLMNQNHQDQHGSSVGFNADIIAGWIPAQYQYSLRPLQHSRYLYLGPSTDIEFTSKRYLRYEDKSIKINDQECGIICENLHSSRHVNVEGQTFLDQFQSLASMLAARGEKIALRPHPGGQYVLKNNVLLPDNVFIDNRPSYKVNWHKYRYGISAPSSILIDFLLYNLPCIVWQDESRTLDISSFKSLPVARSSQQLYDFTQNCTSHSLNISNKILDSPLKTLLANKKKTYLRYVSFFQSIYTNSNHKNSALIYFSPANTRNLPSTLVDTSSSSNCCPNNILILAPGRTLPSAHICLKIPLENEPNNNVYVYEESDLIVDKNLSIIENFSLKVNELNINSLILCRSFGAKSEQIAQHAKNKNICCIYFIDDDLIKPCSIALSAKKYKMHSDPKRVSSILKLLNNVDFVLASTSVLRDKLHSYGIKNKIYSNAINCSPLAIHDESKWKTLSKTKTIGYMGFGHGADFQVVLDSITELMRQYQFLKLELIGSIELPHVLHPFQNRIKVYPPIFDYYEFLKFLNGLSWSVGICPLAFTEFNSCKSINKWVEYASCGIPVVATKNNIYDDCVADDCGILCDDSSESWTNALTKVLFDENFSNKIRRNAFVKVWTQYSPIDHARQLTSILPD